MRLSWLAAASILIAGPACADVTARYAMGPAASGMPAMIIEVNDRGDARIKMGNQAALLVLDGISYMIQADLQGVYVARYDDLTALIGERFRAMTQARHDPTLPSSAGASPAPEFVEAGAETVAGRTGTRWTMRHSGPDGPVEGMDVVISSDPGLAPVGRLMARQFDMSANGVRTIMGSVASGAANNFGNAMRSLLARGAPLRMGHIMRLESVDNRPVLANEFALPSPPLTRAQLETRLGWGPVPEPAAGSAH